MGDSLQACFTVSKTNSSIDKTTRAKMVSIASAEFSSLKQHLSFRQRNAASYWCVITPI
jgi:hypothetical protein